MNIYLQRDGGEAGPFTWIEVFVMLQKGGISSETLARAEDENTLRTIEEIGLWREGDEIGPFTWEEVAYLVREGVLDSGVQVRSEGEESLTSLGEALETDKAASAEGDQDSEPLDESRRVPESFVSRLKRQANTAWPIVFELFRRRGTVLGAILVLAGFVGGWLSRGVFMRNPVQVSLPASALAEPAEESVSKVAVPAMPQPEAEAAIATEKSTAGIEPPVKRAEEPVARDDGAAGKTAPESPVGDLPALPAPVAEQSLAVPEQAALGAIPGKQVESGREIVPAPPSPTRADSKPAQIVAAGEVKLTQPATPQAATRKKPLEKIEKLKPFDTPQLSEQELSEILEERFSSTPIVIPESYDERPGAGLQIVEGAFTLDTKLVDNPKVEVIYRVPQRSKNNPGPDADNIVMVGIFHGAIQPRARKIVDGKEIVEKSRLHGFLMPFADRLGYSAFTFHIKTTPEMAADKSEYYAYGGPEWVDLTYRAKAEIERRHKLKERKLLLFGVSEGGQFVQNIAAAAPEKVAAISAQSGPNLTPPEMPSSTAWFLAITRGDAMQADYDRLYNRLLEQNATVAFNIFQPDYRGRGLGGNFYHSQSAIATTASRSYLRGVVDRFDSKGNIDRTRWPYVRDRMKPLRIYAAGSSQAKNIPLLHREYLPSQAFVKCLQAVPAPMQTVTLSTGGVKTVKAFIGIPPLGKPKGVLVYTQAFNFLELQHMFDNIYYLAAMGYVVIAPQMKKNDDADLLGALHFARDSEVLRKYPVAVMGYGPKANIAWNVVARNPELAPKAIAMLEFSPKDSFDESKLPPGCRMEVPVVFVYDEAPLVEVETSEEARKSGELVSSVKSFVMKCQERNQLAKVVIVEKPKPKKNRKPISEDELKKLERVRVAQLSLEAAEKFISNVVEQKTSQIKR